MLKGKEITFYERERIETYLRIKKKKIWIAKKLNRDYSIIKREVKRNSGKVLPYLAINAQYYAERRKKNYQRQRKFSRKQRHYTLKNRVSIHRRKKIVNERKRFGDWETDSVIFSGKSILSTQNERKSRLCRIHKYEDKSALASENALRDSIDSLPNLWLTITRDNGTENVLHHETKVPSYFCDPYCSWQKGGVENLNGLIREYLPKRSNLDLISEKEIYLIQEKLNNRPRKCLNYLTPNEVIATELKKGL